MIENKNSLQFPELNMYDNIVHLYTKKPFDFCKEMQEIDQKRQYQEIEEILNYQFKYIKKPLQTHTNNVEIVNLQNINSSFKNVDGLITNLKGVALVTSSADCQSILLFDPVKNVIANVHSGWRGTLNKIVEKAVLVMQNNFCCKREHIKAFICPSILKCCFEVDEYVANMFKTSFTGIDDFIFFSEKNNKYFIDTVGINKQVLENLGLKKENIISSDICTKCNCDIFHSYRGENTLGRNIAIICLK